MAYARKNSPQFWCNSFFSLNVPERIRQGFDWSVTYSIKMRFKNLWFVLLQNKFMLSQIHFNGGSSVAGLGNTRGGGFVFLKHYHRQCICWLDYFASYPSEPCNFSISVFPLDFVLIVCRSFLLTASGTWHFIIVYMYIQQVVILTLVPS